MANVFGGQAQQGKVVQYLEIYTICQAWCGHSTESIGNEMVVQCKANPSHEWPPTRQDYDKGGIPEGLVIA